MGEVVNFNDLIKAAGDAGFQLFPKAWYDVIVDSATPGKTGSGKDCINIKYRVISGPYAASTARIANKMTLSPDNANALSFWFQYMEAMGLPQSWFSQLPAQPVEQLLAYVAQALVGRQCRISVDDSREFNGRKQNDVLDVQPPAGGPAGVGPAAPQVPQPGVPQMPNGGAPGGGLQQFTPPQPAQPQFTPQQAQQFQGGPGVAGPPAPPVPMGQPAGSPVGQQQFAQPPAPQMPPPASPFTAPQSPFAQPPQPQQVPQQAQQMPFPAGAPQAPQMPQPPQVPGQPGPQPPQPQAQPQQPQQPVQQQAPDGSYPPPPPPPGQLPF